jgi:hypothetical protein
VSAPLSDTLLSDTHAPKFLGLGRHSGATCWLLLPVVSAGGPPSITPLVPWFPVGLGSGW